jgi:hypothetical protein
MIQAEDSTPSARTAALRYAGRGWRVLPIHWPTPAGACSCAVAGCANAAKHPHGALAPHGLLDATTDAATIRRWWERAPYASVGIATGIASGLLVLDVDPRHGGDEALRDLEAQHGPLPDTVRALTGGGGVHLVFRYPAGSVPDVAPASSALAWMSVRKAVTSSPRRRSIPPTGATSGTLPAIPMMCR